jgi:ribulose-bisphosphate carboxylase large chain
MGLPALAWLREFAEVPIHGHRAGLAGSMRSPALGLSYRVWQQLARLAGADHLHASGLGSKFYETDDEVAGNVRSLLEPLGATLAPVPTLSSGQNVMTAAPTYAAVRSTDLLMLAGGGVAAHPDGPAAGVRSLRDAWSAAIDGVPLQCAADLAARTGEPALLHAVQKFGDRTSQGGH